MSIDKNLLTISQAAKQLGVSTKTLRRWEQRGVLIGSRTVGNQRRYLLDEIKNFDRSKTKPSVPMTAAPSATMSSDEVPILKTTDYKVQIGQTSQISPIRPISLIRTLPNLSRIFASAVLVLAAGVITSLWTYGGFGPVNFFSRINGVKDLVVGNELAKIEEATPIVGGQVLGAVKLPNDFTFNVNVASNFSESATFAKDINLKGKLIAPNVINTLSSGTGILIKGTQNTPIVTNTGVISLGGKTGAVSLEAGSGISVDGVKITNTGISSLSAGSGISVSGSTITNSDTGSSQKIFKTISVAGQDDIVADSNTDTLTFAPGTGITLSADSTNNKLTVTGVNPGVTHGTGVVYLTETTDKFGIGSITPAYMLDVTGDGRLTTNLTLGGALNAGGITSKTYNAFATASQATTHSLSASNDLYVGGSLEIGGTIYGTLSGGLNAGFSEGAVPFTNSSGNLVADSTNFNYNASSQKLTLANFGVSTYVYSNLIPNTGSQYDIGTSARKWKNVYADTITATTLSITNTDISGTISQDFLINSDYTGDDAEDSTITFERGSPAVNAQFKWDSAHKYTSSNAPFVIRPDAGITPSGTAALVVNQTQDQDIFSAMATDVTKFVIKNSGSVGVGTTAPVGLFSVGDGSQFSVSTTGNITKINNVATSFPATQGAANSLLRNDGSGNFSWADPTGTGVIGYWNRSGTTLSPSNSADSMGIMGNLGVGTTAPASLLHLYSTSTSTSFQGFNLDWQPTVATTLTNDLFRINVGSLGILGSLGNLFNILDNGSSLFSVSQTQINSNLPHAFNAAGDVSMAYDLIFANQMASNIKSFGPLTIDAGENWESNDLTLRTYGTGNLVLDIAGGNLWSDGTNVGIGTTSPIAGFDVQKTVWLRGAAAGASGLFVNSSGNVGIGTTSPAAKLEVAGTSWLRGGTTTSGLFVDANGNTGIGTTSPSNLLHIYENTSNTTTAGLMIEQAGAGDAVTHFALAGGQNYSVGIDNSNEDRFVIQAGSTFSADGVKAGLAMDSLGKIAIGLHYPQTRKLTITDTAAGVLNYAIGLRNNSNSLGTATGILFMPGGWTDDYGKGGLIYSRTNDYQRGDFHFLQNTLDDSSLPTLANSVMTIKNSGNVGIGTTSPGAKLDVVGNIRVKTGNGLQLYETNNANYWTLKNTTNDLTFTLNTTEYMRIMNGGNVGIGTTSPAAKLEVAGTSWLRGGTTTSGLFVDANGNTGIGTTGPSSALDVIGAIEVADGTELLPSVTFGTDTDTGFWRGGSGLVRYSANGSYSAEFKNTGIFSTFATMNAATDPTAVPYSGYGDVNTGMYFPAADKLGFSAGGTGTLFITAGNVGIGTTSPSAKLSIFSDGDAMHLGTDTNTANYISFAYNPSTSLGRGSFGYDPVLAAMTIQGGASKGVAFNVNNSTFGSGTAMLINSSGNVGIGTTSPASALQVSGTAWLRGGTTTSGLFVDSNGNVGVGTTGPVYDLDITKSSTGAVVGNIKNSNAAGSAAYLLQNDLSYWNINAYGSGVSGNLFGIAKANTVMSFSTGVDAVIGTFSNNNLIFGTNNLERVRITKEGNVGIGTTNPGSTLDIVGSTNINTGSAYLINGLNGLSIVSTNNAGWGGDNLLVGANAAKSWSGSYKAGSVYVGVGAAGSGNLSDGRRMTVVGAEAGYSLTSGNYGVFIGYQAGYSWQTDPANVVIGPRAAYQVTGGIDNTIMGNNALYTQTGSTNNTTALGSDALFYYNTAGTSDNTAVGNAAGYKLVSGVGNSFLGSYAGVYQGSGDYNITLGYASGRQNLGGGITSSGSKNIIIGTWTGQSMLTGKENTFIGHSAATSNTNGNYNVYLGRGTGYGNITGSYNTALGTYASETPTNLDYTVAIGYDANPTASRQLVIGSSYNNTSYITEGYFGSGVTATTPQAFTINSTGGSGTNIAGANLAIAGGKGTGSGLGGSIYFKTATTGSSGTGLNSLTDRMVIDSTGNVGIGTTAPAGLLAVGTSSQFTVNSSGDITKIKNLTYSWPSAHVASSYLTNDGSGNLTWTTSLAATSLKWNGLTNPDGAQSLTMGTNATTWNWATGTATNNLFNITTDASANGTGTLLNVQSGTTSSLIPLRVRAGTVEGLAVNSEGSVGIGTYTPIGKFEVTTGGGGVSSADVIPVMTSNTAPIGIASAGSEYTGAAWKAFDDNGATVWNTLDKSSGWLAYQFSTSKKAFKYSLTASATPSRMVNDWTFEGWDGGNWIILDTQINNTWSAGEKRLFPLSNTASYVKYRIYLTSNNGASWVDIAEMEIYDDSGPMTAFMVGSSGDVGIGTTNPTTRLDINGNLNVSGYATMSASLNVGYAGFMGGVGNGIFSNKVGIGTTAPGVALDVVGNARFSAVGAGEKGYDLNITSDGTLTTSTSDISMKTNIVDMDNTLAKLITLRPVTFNWKESGEEDLGLIAQEVAQIFPGLTFINSTDGKMGINYSRIPALLIKGMQEQQGQLNNFQLSMINNQSNLNDQLSMINDQSITNKLESNDQLDIKNLTLKISNLDDKYASVSAELDLLKTEMKTLVSKPLEVGASPLIATDSAQIATDSAVLGASTSAVLQHGEALINGPVATLSALMVSGESRLYDVNIAGGITAGLLSINNECVDSTNCSLASISSLVTPLKIQNNLSANVEIMGNKVEIDTKGNLKISEGDLTIEKGKIKGNDNIRGAEKIISGQTSIEVKKTWDTAPVSITTTTSYDSYVWITNLTETGFTINVKNAPSKDEKVYWTAMW